MTTPGTLGQGPPLVLRRARLDDGRLVDVTVSADGAIAAIDPAGSAGEDDDVATIDLDGWLLLTGAVEPHAHLDKALTADTHRNPTGDLAGAVRVWQAHWPELTFDDVATRAEAAARRSLAAGITSIRTHVDIGVQVGLVGVEALLDVRERLRGLVDVQICGLLSLPTSGDAGAPLRELLDEAVGLGIDVVGGCPFLDPDPVAATRHLVDVAEAASVPIDLHTDETLDPSILTVCLLAREVASRGFDLGATASHCVSLGVQPVEVQREVAAELAAAPVAVVALPHTNLFLQAREERTAPPRGVTAIASLREAGATVAVGADNLQDPFNSVGRADPFETAALLVMVCHLTPEEAWHHVTVEPARALGLPVPAIEVGAPADLLAVPSSTVRQAIADAPAARLVLKRGRVVARSTAEVTVLDR